MNFKKTDNDILFEILRQLLDHESDGNKKQVFAGSPYSNQMAKESIEKEILKRKKDGSWQKSEEKRGGLSEKLRLANILYDEETNITMKNPVDISPIYKIDNSSEEFFKTTASLHSNVIFCSTIFKKTQIAHTGAVKKNHELIWYIREKLGKQTDQAGTLCFIGDNQVCIEDLMDFVRQEYNEQWEWLIANKYYLFVLMNRNKSIEG